MLKEFYQVIHHVVREEERAAVAYILGKRLTDVDEEDVNKVATENILAAGLTIAKAEETERVNDVYGLLKEADYTPDNWTLIGEIKDTAVGAIQVATTIGKVINSSELAINDMLKVEKV